MHLLYMCACENFGTKFFYGGENVKLEKISFYLEKGQNGNFVEILQAKTWKFSRSQMTKWTSPLESSREI